MGKRLLVADDSATIQKVIKLALSSNDYEILTVSNGKDAIRTIEQEHPDVVLIDMALPDANASSVKRKIQSQPHLSSIKFILMASAYERIDEVLAPDVQFDERLIKPFDPAHLRKMIAKLMEMGTVATPFTETISIPEKPLDLPPVIPSFETVSEGPKTKPVTTEEFEMGAPLQAEEEVAKVRALENDIKNLTESTIKMSGVEELHWNLDDKRKMKTAIAPSSMPPNMPAPSTFPVDDGGSSFLKAKQKGLRNIKPTPDVGSFDALPATMPKSEVEQMIRQNVEAMVEKLARQMIADVAEKIVRKEIEKILAEP